MSQFKMIPRILILLIFPLLCNSILLAPLGSVAQAQLWPGSWFKKNNNQTWLYPTLEQIYKKEERELKKGRKLLSKVDKEYKKVKKVYSKLAQRSRFVGPFFLFFNPTYDYNKHDSALKEAFKKKVQVQNLRNDTENLLELGQQKLNLLQTIRNNGKMLRLFDFAQKKNAPIDKFLLDCIVHARSEVQSKFLEKILNLQDFNYFKELASLKTWPNEFQSTFLFDYLLEQEKANPQFAGHVPLSQLQLIANPQQLRIYQNYHQDATFNPSMLGLLESKNSWQVQSLLEQNKISTNFGNLIQLQNLQQLQLLEYLLQTKKSIPWDILVEVRTEGQMQIVKEMMEKMSPGYFTFARWREIKDIKNKYGLQALDYFIDNKIELQSLDFLQTITNEYHLNALDFILKHHSDKIDKYAFLSSEIISHLGSRKYKMQLSILFSFYEMHKSIPYILLKDLHDSESSYFGQEYVERQLASDAYFYYGLPGVSLTNSLWKESIEPSGKTQNEDAVAAAVTAAVSASEVSNSSTQAVIAEHATTTSAITLMRPSAVDGPGLTDSDGGAGCALPVTLVPSELYPLRPIAYYTSPYPALDNLGNTCFANSVHKLLAKMIDDDESWLDLFDPRVNKLSQWPKESAASFLARKDLQVALYYLMEDIVSKDTRTITHDTYRLYRYFMKVVRLRNDIFGGPEQTITCQQFDPHEYLGKIFEYMDLEKSNLITRLKEKKIIPGVKERTVELLQTMISLNVNNSTSAHKTAEQSESKVLSVQNFLNQYLEGESFPEFVHKKTSTHGMIKRPYFTKAPYELLVHLKRFVFDREGEEGRKITDLINVNEELLLPITIEATEEKRLIRYVPRAVVVHKGTKIDDGHYYIYVRENNKWVFHSDDKVLLPDQALAELDISRKCYMIYYRRAD